MNRKITYLNITLLCALATGGLADGNNSQSNNLTYCPTVNALKTTLCHPQGQFNSEQIKFPQCLILLKGKTYTFDNGQRWKIISLSPSINDNTQLNFDSAYFNEQGTYCSYTSKDENTFLRLQFISAQNTLEPVANGQWQQDIQNKHVIFKAGAYSSQDHYLCQITSPNPSDIKLCPFLIVPQKQPH